MKTRFADTSFWFARHEPQDRHHEAARRIDPGTRIVTTEWVLGETWTLVNQWGNHQGAVRCLEAIRAFSNVEVETVTAADLQAAWAWLRRHDERPYSFVDAVSFRVMQRRRLTEALAFDGDFSAAGFVEVRPGRR
ncbi:MAG: PIN domain-containing protein [Actinomycetota bacterium]